MSLNATDVQARERSFHHWEGWSECETCGAQVWDDGDTHTVADCLRSLRAQIESLNTEVRAILNGVRP